MGGSMAAGRSNAATRPTPAGAAYNRGFGMAGTDGTTRRGLLRGAGVAGIGAAGIGAAGIAAAAAATVTACGRIGPRQSRSPSRSGPVVLGPTSDVPVGGGKIYPDQIVVVTQPTAGTFRCFGATCTHAGCLLHDVSGGTINCACHGSEFAITDGSVVRPPAEQPLPHERISVANGTITLD